MNDLARHLIEAGSHGGLPFHPACPACREERLAGALGRSPLVPRRAQAGLAAALLAATAVAPAAALAAPPAVAPEPESEQQGADEPGGPVPSAPGGGDATPASGADTRLDEQPLTVSPPDEGSSETDEPGALEQPPLDDGGDEDAGTAAGRAPAGKPTAPSDAAGGDRGARGEEPTGERAGRPEKAEGPPKADAERDQARDVRKREPRRGLTPATAPAAGAPAEATRVSAPAAPAGALAAPEDATAPVAGTAAADPVAPGARVHVVRAGESLWSIARDLLGPRATNAEVAREVQRIWDRNAAAIGTGDPDLLSAGQTLRLR